MLKPEELFTEKEDGAAGGWLLGDNRKPCHRHRDSNSTTKTSDLFTALIHHFS